MTREQRFWAKVKKTSGCWLWIGAKTSGYGIFRDSDGRTRRAHRIAWEMNHGKIPSGMDLCHKCDVRNCVRDDHLFIGTRLDNVRDCIDKGRDAPPPVRSGEKNGNSRLTSAIIKEIRNRYANGARQVDLAEFFGVSQAAISKIVRGEWWKHLL